MLDALSDVLLRRVSITDTQVYQLRPSRKVGKPHLVLLLHDTIHRDPTIRRRQSNGFFSSRYIQCRKSMETCLGQDLAEALRKPSAIPPTDR